jgi:hypothetical protein
MKLYAYKDIEESQGNICLWYGASGAGKTATLLQTCEDPIVYLTGEDRSIKTTLAAINRPNLKLKVGRYESFNDFLETLANYELFAGAKSIIVDSLTHIMNIHLQDEILAESYEALDKKKGVEKELAMRSKMSLEGYGTLSVSMKRLMSLLQSLSQHGFDIHCTARVDSQPKWDRSLAAAPALSGKEFGRDFVGFLDFIGLVTDNVNTVGDVVYPPLVSCQTDGSYLAKWTGVTPEGGVINKPFNVKSMLAFAHGLKATPDKAVEKTPDTKQATSTKDKGEKGNE